MRADARAAAGVAVMLAALPLATLAAGPDADRRGELEHLLAHDCGSCHGMRLTGGLGPPLTPAALAPRSPEALEQVIAAGVPGTPMPPWLGLLDRAEIRWLARRLKEGERHD